jgi:hypothetical protein
VLKQTFKLQVIAINMKSQTDIPEPKRLRRIVDDGRILKVWMTAAALMIEAGEVLDGRCK